MTAQFLCTLILFSIALFFAKGSHASRDAFDVFTTEAFFVPIKKESFGRAFDADDEIDFIASIAGMPDLPKWMNCRHVNGSHEAYLYGTPSVNDDGDIEIEIIAMNKYNYNTFQDNLKFRITAREKIAKFQVEMKFFNLNIEDMFINDRLLDVWNIFSKKLWKESNDVYITKIASPLDVGGRLPLDPREKEGVVIRIGSTDNFTRDLLDLEREVDRIKNRDPCPRKYKATSAEHIFRGKGFYSDWCSFQLLKPVNENQPQVSSSKIETSASVTIKDIIEDVDYKALNEPFPKRDYTLDVIFCFVIPMLIGTMVISSLTCIFFYNKEDLMIQSEETAVEMQQYDTIERASRQLRQLANNDRSCIPVSANSTQPILRTISPSSTLPKAISDSLPPGSRTSTLKHVSYGPNPMM